MYLRVKMDRTVTLSCPRNAFDVELLNMVHSRMDWIKQKLAQFEQVKNEQVIHSETLIPGSIHYYLGKPYKIVINQFCSRNRVEMLEVEGCHQLIIDCQSTDLCQAILEKWYRQKFYQLLPELANKWQLVVGKQANEWRIKKMKTRWGTCNITDKRIWLNLALIRMPIECIEHVIVHELVHLIERGHNARFYQLMDRFMPQWRSYDALMTKYALLKF
jgi:Predicted metal-dependent hydrolase